jgi:hypothetical protein
METEDLLRWRETFAWSDPDEAAFRELDERSQPQRTAKRSFEEEWPPAEVVDAWVRAALRLTASGQHIRLTPRHAEVLATQVTRGYGWGTGPRELARARIALLAASLGETDLTVRMLGGGPLASRLSTGRAPTSLRAIVRHVATAARHRLGEATCAAALRGYGSSEGCEPEVFWVLAQLAVDPDRALTPAETRASVRALVGLELPASEAASSATASTWPKIALRPAPTDDPRVSIFERYMLVLGDPAKRTELEAEAAYILEDPTHTSWDFVSSFVAQTLVFGFDDLIDKTRTTLLALEPRRDPVKPSPGLVLRAAMGHPVEDWRALLRTYLEQFHKPTKVSALRSHRWSTAAAAVALVAGDTKLTRLLAGERKGMFRPALRLGDEPRVVIAYFAQALEARSSGRAVQREDVEPAWEDLVANRLPDDHDNRRTGGAFGWASFVCLAVSLFHDFGGEEATEVPRLLRQALRGGPAR